jgi:hypothetical protein
LILAQNRLEVNSLSRANGDISVWDLNAVEAVLAEVGLRQEIPPVIQAPGEMIAC